MMIENQIAVFIFGSCVSRDTAELRGDRWRRVAYVARQSLISSTNVPIPMPAPTGLSSAFQASALEGDFNSSLLDELTTKGADVDRIIIDLVDERLGIYPYANGGFLTFSNELHQSKLMLKMKGRGAFIEFGTDEHFALWIIAVEKFHRLISKMGLMHKIRVIRAPFVDCTDDGHPVALTRNQSSSQWNKLYERYYTYLDHIGMKIITIPDESLQSSDSHKWGPAQYHYVDSAYVALAQQIEE